MSPLTRFLELSSELRVPVGDLEADGDKVRELVVPRHDAHQLARVYPQRLKELGHHTCRLITHTLQFLNAATCSYLHSFDGRLAKFYVRSETCTVGGRDTELPVLVGLCGMPWDAPLSWWWRRRGVVPSHLVNVRQRQLRAQQKSN